MNNEQPKRIGAISRFVALIVDNVLVYFLTTILAPYIILGGASLGATAVGATGTNAGEQWAGGMIGGFLGAASAILIAFPLVMILYFAIEGITGYTVGKYLLGLQIANPDGTKATVKVLLTRFAIKVSPFIFLFIAFASPLYFPSEFLIKMCVYGFYASFFVVGLGHFMALSPSAQALHDVLAKTAVFSRKNLSS